MSIRRSTIHDWVIRPTPNPQAALRLFCLPYAGGGATIFRSWPELLPAEIEVCPIQLPGRENRYTEPLFTRLAPLVKMLAYVVQPHLSLPFAIFGHSMGALLGFELARQLRREYGVTPAHLFVSARPAPQRLALQAPNETPLSDDELRQVAHELNGPASTISANPDLLGMALPILRADTEICETYRYGDEAPLDCPITAFGGNADHTVSEADLDAWREQTGAAFTRRMFPGDHFFLNNEPTALLDAIAHELALPAMRDA